MLADYRKRRARRALQADARCWPGLCCSATSERQDSIIIVFRLPRLQQGPSELHFMASGTRHGFRASRACVA